MGISFIDNEGFWDDDRIDVFVMINDKPMQ